MFGRLWAEKIPPACPDCGYDLRKLASRRCPECGCAPTFAELRQAARNTADAAAEFKNVRESIRVGIGAAILGYAVVLAGLANGGFGVGMLVGLFCAIIAIGSGANVCRARRLPPAAAALLPVEPDYKTGAVVILLGVVLLVLSLFFA